jgi:hypothetical protein
VIQGIVATVSGLIENVLQSGFLGAMIIVGGLSGATSTITVSKAAAKSSYLAVGTERGMELWSASTGARPIGPAPTYSVQVYSINWSANGRYLTWIQAPMSDATNATDVVVEFDVQANVFHEWRSAYAISNPVPGPRGVAVTYIGSNELLQYDLDQPAPKVIKLQVSALATLSAYDEGFWPQ